LRRGRWAHKCRRLISASKKAEAVTEATPAGRKLPTREGQKVRTSKRRERGELQGEVDVPVTTQGYMPRAHGEGTKSRLAQAFRESNLAVLGGPDSMGTRQAGEAIVGPVEAWRSLAEARTGEWFGVDGAVVEARRQCSWSMIKALSAASTQRGCAMELSEPGVHLGWQRRSIFGCP
jgi:hypothetical protein